MANLATSPIDSAHGHVSSWYGMRNRPGGPRWHEGLDIAAPRGTPVRAILPGKIYHVTPEPWSHGSDPHYQGYGRNVVIYYPSVGLWNLYGHLDSIAPGIVPGHKVERGTTLGFVGGSDSEHAIHLHWALRTNAPGGRPGWPYLYRGHTPGVEGLDTDPVIVLRSLGIRLDSSGRFIPQANVTPNHTGLLTASPTPAHHEGRTNKTLWVLATTAIGGLLWFLRK